jgi:hypothetical protein
MALEFRAIERAAKDQGWTSDRTARGHRRLRPPDPSMKPCIYGGTPGDRRAIRNFLSDCRRSGLIWPWPQRGGAK